MITIYNVFKNADQTEGRGPMVFVRSFLNENAAIAYTHKHGGVMGRSDQGNKLNGLAHQDWRVISSVAVESLSEANEQDKKELVLNALKRLTMEEKEALGLKGKF